MNDQKYVPILFQGEMVRAILEGRKSQTRRVISPPPDENCMWGYGTHAEKSFVEAMRGKYAIHARFNGVDKHVACPWQKGQILWVKETWSQYRAFGNETEDDAPVIYRADEDHCGQFPCTFGGNAVMVNNRNPWKSPRYMPKRHARIFLKVKSVRVERLQDISEVDAIAEGIEGRRFGIGAILYRDYGRPTADEDGEELPFIFDQWVDNPITSYRTLWEKINGKGSWEQNPYVYMIEFEWLKDFKNPFL